MRNRPMSTTSSSGSSILSTLESALGALNPLQLLNLGKHLTAAQQLQISSDLDNATPATIGTYANQISAIPNVPPAVMAAVNRAVNVASKTPFNQQEFDSAIDAAQSALVQSVTSANTLSSIL
jgi:hypothetical protein